MAFSPKNKNNKLYLLFAICLIVILIMWLYTLKLNLLRETNSDFSFKEVFGDLGSVLNDLPELPKAATTTPTLTSEFLEQITKKLKN